MLPGAARHIRAALPFSSVALARTLTIQRKQARARSGDTVKWLGTVPGRTPTGFALKRLYSATLNSLRGLGYGVWREAALRQEAIVLTAALPLGMIAAPSLGWYVAMIGSLLVVLAIELLNTAIEKLADYVTRERHVEIRRIKDLGSAAVFCALCLAGLIWLAALALRLGLF